MLTDRPELLKDKDDEMLKTSKKWFKEISNIMVGYLRNTTSTLAIRGVDLTDAIINVICFRIINSKSASAELLRHGILPTKSPPFITLYSYKMNSISFKVNLELESYITMSIEKYLKLNCEETLADTYFYDVLSALSRLITSLLLLLHQQLLRNAVVTCLKNLKSGPTIHISTFQNGSRPECSL
jgi:hypothetical protein